MKFEKKLLATCVAMAAISLAACNSSDDDDKELEPTPTPTETTISSGSLKAVDFNPLAAEIAAGTLAPADVTGGHSCPTGTSKGESTSVELEGVTFPVCLLSSHLTGNTTYTLTNDYVYVLTEYIKVGNGGVEDTTAANADATILNIDAGVQIFADAGNKAGIRVTRGATINVNGTATMPVIMSAADFDLSGGEITGGTDYTGRGEWGGLVVNGYAPVNGGDDTGNVPNESSSEAAPATETDVFYGGNDAADSSGSMTYLVIAESGVAFQPDAELQGLTLEGVGSGTTISYVQVLGSEDDGIEWFGGSVDVDHIVINGQDDDGLDFDDGYNGNVSFAIIRLGSNDGDTGIEADGGKASGDAYSTPTLSNITILGNVGKSSKSTKGANFKENFSGKLYRSAFVADSANTVVAGDFDGACIDVDTATAAANAKMVDVVCSSAASISTGDDIAAFEAGANNDMSSTTLTIDATTLAVSGAAATDLDGTGFVKGDDTTAATPADYIGAVDPAATSGWWDGWTVHLAK